MIPRRAIPIRFGDFFEILKDAESAHDLLAFESAFARFVGVRGAVSFASGRAAMAMALDEGRGPGRDEVLVPAYTLKTLVPLIAALGFKIRYADIDPHTFNVTAETLAPCLSERTHAVLAPDLFGNPLDLAPIAALCRAKGAFLLEDAAHAAGSLRDGAPVGRGADAAFFSFDTIKPINAFGGGILVSDDEAFLTRIRQRRPTLPGLRGPVLKKILGNVFERGLQATGGYALALRLLASDTLREPLIHAYLAKRDATVPRRERLWLAGQARLAKAQLDSLPARIERRRALADRLIQALQGRVEFQREVSGALSNRYFLVGLVPEAKAVQRRLLRAGLDVGREEEITDFVPPFTQAAAFPVAWKVYTQALQFPCSPDFSEAEQETLLRRARKVLGTT